MNDIVIGLRKEAARILQEDIVDVVIGFASGSVPFKSRPILIRRPENARSLIVDGLCRSNLAAYLIRRPVDERTGIICRGCESRALQVLVNERQRRRDRLYVIGIPCRGILDELKLRCAAGDDIQNVREQGDQVFIATRSGERPVERSNLLHHACGQCRYPDPIGADIDISERVGPKNRSVDYPADGLEELSAAARHAFFAAETDRCIRCYACREACPMCYCTQCFVDYSAPRWIESTAAPAGKQAWHIVRAFHQTGRCVACGACERACPMGIRMTYLTDHLNRHVEQSYGFVAGREEERHTLLAAFSLEDAQRFEE